MKLKDKQTPNFQIKSPYKNNIFNQPVCVLNSVDSSVKKSSRSTYLTERSSSRNKVMIPNSPKLANFFNSTRPYSSQKSFSTTSTDHFRKSHHQQKKQKIEFLKYNINRDYFDENAEKDLKGQNIKHNNYEQLNQKTLCSMDLQKRVLVGHLQQNSYRSETLIRNQSSKLSFPKIKQPSPKLLPHQFLNIIGTQKEKKHKIQIKGENKCKGKQKSAKDQFEYTFGLNY